ncbi:MAG: tetratricopeptide repeat protein [Vicinamibacterales bacterium]|jgi:hypothetical protein|nr:hypothetical protein [Acidobacteriota bacterium]MDP6608874.1 tetratricopeptide repeat protein [Vicinamibacterales bacterium]|tara:strand:+ start:60 stop:1148 length:1089 start_codon:yes stop_codon:yes gene_type:complete
MSLDEARASDVAGAGTRLGRRCYDDLPVDTPPDPMSHHSPPAWHPLVVLVLLPVFGAAACAGGNDAVFTRLPQFPTFAHQNAASIALFQEANASAREAPATADRIGRLGMTYHAYRFSDEARRSYEAARDLAPDEYRWIYYQAFLEKSIFDFPAAQSLFRRALELDPDSAEVWAELGDLYLKWNRRDDAAESLARALALDPTQPLAALGQARLALLTEDWSGAVALLTPVLDAHPRLSLAHKYLAQAYGNVGRGDDSARHQSLGDYGSAIETPLMRELHELSIDAILEGGDPSEAPALMQEKCTRCHTSARIEETQRDRRWWAGTVRRMQREAGWAWLSDDQAASVVAYLATRETAPAHTPR